ncbi:non-ribosomal peptide synthetase [Spirosoma sp. 209]|uniref:non-ribosomal peptide synthetase n=1 Tax=Spirosoma sp. 209 TaxID=1955701 RepID=UPI00098D3A6B|nr:non-ribosomal peptide synthetase [Spirosoma sp. 209]
MLTTVPYDQLTAVDFDPFAGPDILLVTHTTEPQREIWLACQFGGNEANRSYNESISLRFTGQLSIPALERAWHALVQRHEALRSAFSADGEQMIVFRELSVPLELVDGSALSAADQDRLVADYLKQDVQTNFDLTHGPLVKAGLIKRTDASFHFVLTAHHIVCDGWSTGILMQDLGRLYSVYVRQQEPVLPPVDAFSQYALEQRAFVETADYRQIEQFWLQQFAGSVPVLDLPADAPRPARRTFQSDRIDFRVDGPLLQAVRQMGAKAGCSLVTTLVATVEVLIHRLTGQTDIVLGLPAAGQSATGHDRLVGHCVNLLPLRSFPQPEMTFGAYLQKRKIDLLDAFDNQQLTFGSLLKKLPIPRDSSRLPLVPMVFNMDMGLADGVTFHGLDYRFDTNPRAFENFEISINATGSADALQIEWSYNTQLFREETIRSFHRQFVELLQTLSASPDTRLGQPAAAPAPVAVTAPVTSPVRADRPGLGRRLPFASDRALHDFIRDTVRQFPHKTALRFKEQTLTYTQLNEQANQLARVLIEAGVQPGDRVGLAVERSLEMVVCLVAVMKTGAAYIPVDPRHPADRIGYVLADAGCQVLLTNRVHQGRFAVTARELLLEDLWPTLPGYATDDLPIRVAGESPVYVLYTSGTTGRPKGVQIKHNSVVNVMLSVQQQPGLSPTDKTVSLATIAFDLATVEIYLPLLTGAELVIVDTDTSRNGPALADLLRTEAITFVQATPATWRMLLESGWRGTRDVRIISCAEALSKDLAQQLLSFCGDLWNFYGPTETTIYATGKKILPDDELITIGQPIANTTIVINPENPDLSGEICISGTGVGIGYLNQATLTAEKFVTDAATGARLYRTGDLGRFLPNGDVQYMGRIDQQIKIRGHRIEPGEIEYNLLQQPDIQDAVVIAREDRPGDQRLVAYVVPSASGSDEGSSEWQEHWNTIYTLGKESESDLDLADQNLDAAIVAQVSDVANAHEQNEEWMQQSVRRIKALKPTSILELGCGGGQLVFELAPHVRQYIATDYSQPAIDTLSKKLQQQPAKWANVLAKTAPADDFTGIEPTSLDMVLIHAVAQYFPDLGYLLKVIERAANATADGGCVFIGGMQGKHTLTMYHAIDLIRRTSGTRTVAEFRTALDRRVQLDDELMADPALFYRLPAFIPRITAVDIQLREGVYRNEATRYDYDIWLYVGTPPAVATPDQRIEWDSRLSVASIGQLLSSHPQQVIQVINLPNRRTAKDHALLQFIGEARPDDFIGEVQDRYNALPETGVDPNDFWGLASQHGFRAHVRWTGSHTDNRFEVVFIPADRRAIPPKPSALVTTHERLNEYVKNPYKPFTAVSKEHIAAWKEQLRQVLPAYMVPTEFVALPKLPVTPNGKIDRKALPKPEPAEAPVVNRFVEAQTPEEKLLAGIWTGVFGLDSISVHDNFFDLGGHSMLAVRVMTQLERETGRRFPLSMLFEYPTIHRLAQLLQPDKPTRTFKSLVPIKPQGSKTPIYIIHGIGLNLLNFSSLSTYMDPEQPIYGLQARGLDGTEEPLNRMEDIAACYIQEVLEQNPTGPYAIAGYSFGGYVAYEMAQQLRAMGKEIKLLAMFDTDARALVSHKSQLSRLVWRIGRQFPKMLFIGRSLINQPKETIRYQQEYFNRQGQLLLEGLGLASKPKPSTELGHMEYIMQKHEEAFEAYRLQPYNGKLDLFRAMTRLYFVDDQVYLGWNDFARQGVRVHDVPGDHATLMYPPNDKALALALQRALDQA